MGSCQWAGAPRSVDVVSAVGVAAVGLVTAWSLYQEDPPPADRCRRRRVGHAPRGRCISEGWRSVHKVPPPTAATARRRLHPVWASSVVPRGLTADVCTDTTTTRRATPPRPTRRQLSGWSCRIVSMGTRPRPNPAPRTNATTTARRIHNFNTKATSAPVATRPSRPAPVPDLADRPPGTDRRRRRTADGSGARSRAAAAALPCVCPVVLLRRRRQDRPHGPCAASTPPPHRRYHRRRRRTRVELVVLIGRAIAIE